MTISALLNRRYQSGSDFLQAQQTVDDTGSLAVSETVAASGTTTISASVTVSTLKAAYIQTSVDDCVFNFDGSTPNLTIKADVPYLWSENCNLTNALSDNFTTVVVTNPSSTTDAQIEMRFIFTV